MHSCHGQFQRPGSLVGYTGDPSVYSLNKFTGNQYARMEEIMHG
jgi:hypothetical protein